jgi:hypothetical protein
MRVRVGRAEVRHGEERGGQRRHHRGDAGGGHGEACVHQLLAWAAPTRRSSALTARSYSVVVSHQAPAVRRPPSKGVLGFACARQGEVVAARRFQRSCVCARCARPVGW